MAIFGGLFCGFLIQNCCTLDNHFDDEEHFLDVLFDIPMEDIPINEKEMKEMKVKDKEWKFFQKIKDI